MQLREAKCLTYRHVTRQYQNKNSKPGLTQAFVPRKGEVVNIAVLKLLPSTHMGQLGQEQPLQWPLHSQQ